MKKEIIRTSDAPEPVGPYSQAVKAGGTLYCSGQIPLNPATGAIPDGINAQTRQVLANLSAVLKAGGADFSNVVKTTVFLKDMNDFPAMNAIYAEAFTGTPPARSTVQAARLPKDVLVEIDAIAVV
ncbi:MAG TPA: RidA family protein [Pontiellaceae bacterium]|mgnify:CR=1 FL=1|nr:RidA family protein [Pontiellaceae bacterium]